MVTNLKIMQASENKRDFLTSQQLRLYIRQTLPQLEDEVYANVLILNDKAQKLSCTSLVLKTMKSRWGSCTKDRKLCFNTRMQFLPANLVDFVIRHEVAHYYYLNHSKQFWFLVCSDLPNAAQLKHDLKYFARHI